MKPAAQMPDRKFLLAGNGWQDKPLPTNVSYLGHVYTHEHNAFNCTPRAVLDVNRESAARYGFSPSARVFEAAGAGACLISDKGVEAFFEPDREVLVAESGDAVVEHLRRLTPERVEEIGRAAYARVLAEHTYAHRADQFEKVLEGKGSAIA